METQDNPLNNHPWTRAMVDPAISWKRAAYIFQCEPDALSALISSGVCPQWLPQYEPAKLFSERAVRAAKADLDARNAAIAAAERGDDRNPLLKRMDDVYEAQMRRVLERERQEDEQRRAAKSGE
jgi:hypothetical protein